MTFGKGLPVFSKASSLATQACAGRLFAVKRSAIKIVALVRKMRRRAYVRSKRGAMNPHTVRIIIAPTIAPMNPAPSSA